MSSNQPKRVLRLSLFWKIFLATLIASLIPALMIAFSSLRAINNIGVEAQNKAAEGLNDKTEDALRVRAEEAAQEIEETLDQAVRDLRFLESLPVDSDAYRKFYRSRTSEMWYLDDLSGRVKQILQALPLYREMVYIDVEGQEMLRIVDGELVPEQELRDVSDPANTTYKKETYFQETKDLGSWDIYVSPVTAWYATNPMQPAQALSADESAQKYKEYEAVVRFAKSVHNAEGEVQGVVMLSLDHRHLMEAVNHIQSLFDEVVWPDYASGNYAYLLDYQGWLIAHPDLSFLRGLDEAGGMLPTWMQDTIDQKLPFNMLISDIKPEANEISSKVLSGQTGKLSSVNRQGVRKVDVYVPIRFDHGVYKDNGIFGGVVLSESVDNFEEAARISRAAIGNKVSELQQTMIGFTIVGALLLVVAAFMVSRNITEPIQMLTDEAHSMEKGEYRVETLDQLVERRIQDEVTDLSRVFKQMAKAVQLRETRLKEEIRQLRIEIDEVKKQEEVQRIVESEAFIDLQEKVKAMRERRQARQEGRGKKQD